MYDDNRIETTVFDNTSTKVSDSTESSVERVPEFRGTIAADETVNADVVVIDTFVDGEYADTEVVIRVTDYAKESIGTLSLRQEAAAQLHDVLCDLLNEGRIND